MRKGKVWIGVLCIGAALWLSRGLIFNKVMDGKFAAMRVTGLTITDIPSRTTYDENGDRQQLSKEDYDGFERDLVNRPIGTRKLSLNVIGAEDVKVLWGDYAVTTSLVNGSQFETDFPVSANSDSIPYRIDASAEGWETVSLWNLQGESEVFKLDYEDQHDGRLQILSIPKLSPGFVTVFRMTMERKDGKGSSIYEWEGTPIEKRREMDFYEKVDQYLFAKLESRRYRTVKSGFLAFGRKGDSATKVRTDGFAQVTAIRQIQRTSSKTIAKWDIKGNAIPILKSDVGGLVMSGMPDSQRMISVGFGIADYSKDIRLRFSSSKGPFVTYGRAGIVGSAGVEWTAWMPISNKAEKFDIYIDVPQGDYREVFRTNKITVGKMRTEESETAILDTSYNAKSKVNRQLMNLMVKVPEEYRNQDLRIRIVKDGQVVNQSSTSLTSTSDGYIGLQMRAVDKPIAGISEVFIEARPYKRTVIKDVPLYPRDTKR